MLRTQVAIILLSLGCCLGEACLDDRSDSGIFGPKYQQTLDAIDGVATDNPSLLVPMDYGTSVSGRPLRLYMLSRPIAVTNRPTIVISGSTHGNEYLNIADRLPKTITELASSSSSVADFVAHGGVFIFVPILNPDGYDKRSRYNSNGSDLNRDWDVPPAGHKGFKQVETRVLADKLTELKRLYHLNYVVTMDYHCCIGAVLYPWAYTTSKKLPPEVLNRHQTVGKLADDVLNIKMGTTYDILGYKPMGTTKDYYYATYGALAFTYEGRYRKEDTYYEEHVQWWENTVDFVNKWEKLRASTEPRFVINE